MLRLFLRGSLASDGAAKNDRSTDRHQSHQICMHLLYFRQQAARSVLPHRRVLRRRKRPRRVDKLPVDLLLDILLFLEAKLRFRMLLVNVRLYHIVNRHRGFLALPEVSSFIGLQQGHKGDSRFGCLPRNTALLHRWSTYSPP